MSPIRRTRIALLIAFGLVLNISALGQEDAQASSREFIASFVAKLDPSQRQNFDNAMQAYSDRRYADSLALYRLLFKEFPGDPVLAKFAGEAAIKSGDPQFAAECLKPVANADPDNWTIAFLLVQACAESGDSQCRDRQIAHMTELHNRRLLPAKMFKYSVEEFKLGDKTMTIQVAPVPYGDYNVYALGIVRDSADKLFMTITLMGGPHDQTEFAKKHPDEAAKGIRKLNLDAYEETGLNSNGRHTQTRYSYKDFVGEPDYATIRQTFIEVVTRKNHASSTYWGLVVR
jgi:hypothetical protein